jgi:hypothetical protein
MRNVPYRAAHHLPWLTAHTAKGKQYCEQSVDQVLYRFANIKLNRVLSKPIYFTKSRISCLMISQKVLCIGFRNVVTPPTHRPPASEQAPLAWRVYRVSQCW